MILRFKASNIVAMVLFIPVLLLLAVIMAFLVPVLAIIVAVSGILFSTFYLAAKGRQLARKKDDSRQKQIDIKDYRIS